MTYICIRQLFILSAFSRAKNSLCCSEITACTVVLQRILTLISRVFASVILSWESSNKQCTTHANDAEKHKCYLLESKYLCNVKVTV